MTTRGLRAWRAVGIAMMAAAGVAIAACASILALVGLPHVHMGEPPVWPEVAFPSALALFGAGGVLFAVARWRLRLRASTHDPA